MPTPVRKDSNRKWLARLAIPVTCLIALYGFWRLSPGVTFAIALVALIGLVIALWAAGAEKD